MDHHVKGEKDLAINAYKTFLEEGGKDKRVYTNLAALLRGEGNAEEAVKIVNIGLQEIHGVCIGVKMDFLELKCMKII